ncbi:biotin--[acetyl-CoA-carboxylase] ligase [Candidatus Woesearchaeota archaeon]|nr:biotin--[acetyl-CoA-carboxylase] ligase [Candidatus Woesearchaeota archaeon]
MGKFKILHFKSLDSTNLQAKKMLLPDRVLPGKVLPRKMIFGKVAPGRELPGKIFPGKVILDTVIVAFTQTAGRGRYKRSWASGKGGLYCSVVLKSVKPAQLPLLTVIAALAVRESVFSVLAKHNALNKSSTLCPPSSANPAPSNPSLPPVGIKWPNDILIGGKKVAGILSESEIRDNPLSSPPLSSSYSPSPLHFTSHFYPHLSCAIVGIGVNTNNSLGNELAKTAVTLKSIVKARINNDKLLRQILAGIKRRLPLLGKNPSSLLREFRNYCMILHKRVRIITGNKVIRGTASGITQEGTLIVKEDGKPGKFVKIFDGTLRER